MLHIESDEQIKLMKVLCGVPYRGLTVKDFCFAISNGGSRGGRRAMMQAARKVAEGLTKGVPDLCIPVPTTLYHGLYVELKKPRTDGGKPSDVKKEQKEWISRLRELGYKVEVCFGSGEALLVILQYLGVKI